MDLLNPDVGDILDRITILHLKLVHAKEAHWEQQLTALYDRLGLAQGGPHCLQISALRMVQELAAVNAAIWQATDEMTAAEKTLETDVERAGMAAATFVRCFAWNRRRQELIRQLNDTLGRGDKREKV